jgi:hypothetical protein
MRCRGRQRENERESESEIERDRGQGQGGGPGLAMGAQLTVCCGAQRNHIIYMMSLSACAVQCFE